MNIDEVYQRLNQAQRDDWIYFGKINGDQVSHMVIRYNNHRIPSNSKNHIELENYGVRRYIVEGGQLISSSETSCISANQGVDDCVEFLHLGETDVRKALKKHFGGLDEEVIRSAGLA